MTVQIAAPRGPPGRGAAALLFSSFPRFSAFYFSAFYFLAFFLGWWPLATVALSSRPTRKKGIRLGGT